MDQTLGRAFAEMVGHPLAGVAVLESGIVSMNVIHSAKCSERLVCAHIQSITGSWKWTCWGNI